MFYRYREIAFGNVLKYQLNFKLSWDPIHYKKIYGLITGITI